MFVQNNVLWYTSTLWRTSLDFWVFAIFWFRQVPRPWPGTLLQFLFMLCKVLVSLVWVFAGLCWDIEDIDIDKILKCFIDQRFGTCLSDLNQGSWCRRSKRRQGLSSSSTPVCVEGWYWWFHNNRGSPINTDKNHYINILTAPERSSWSLETSSAISLLASTLSSTSISPFLWGD